MAEAVLRLLTKRFGVLDVAVESRIRGANLTTLEGILERALTSSSVDEALG